MIQPKIRRNAIFLSCEANVTIDLFKPHQLNVSRPSIVSAPKMS